jgi:hypothetical protein
VRHDPWRATAGDAWRAEREQTLQQGTASPGVIYHGVRGDPLTDLLRQVPDNPSEDFKPSEYFERIVPDGEGNSALHHAVMKRDIDAIRYVLSLGGDINVPNAHGVTPLAVA